MIVTNHRSNLRLGTLLRTILPSISLSEIILSFRSFALHSETLVKEWKSEFDLKWNIVSHRMFI